MEEDLERRVRRLYAAIGEVEVADLSKFPPRTGLGSDPRYLFQDFRGGLTDEQLENVAHSAIAHVANLIDHLRKWARTNGRAIADIETVVAQSDAIRLLLDLADREKHGGDRRDGGFSGRNPTLGRVVRAMEVRPPKGVPVEVLFGPKGPIVTPGANPRVVLMAPILDGDGRKIADLHPTVLAAVQALEALLRAWGILGDAA